MHKTNTYFNFKKNIIIKILTKLQDLAITMAYYWDVAYLHLLRNKGAHIGEHVFAQHFSTEENFAKLLYVEDEVIFAYGVRVILHDSALNNICGVPVKFGKVIIRKKAYIGAGSIILPGVEIGEKAVVGAGSLVTKDIPAGKVAYGVPARIMDTTENLKTRFLKSIEQDQKSVNSRFHYLDILPFGKKQAHYKSREILEMYDIFIEDINRQVETESPLK